MSMCLSNNLIFATFSDAAKICTTYTCHFWMKFSRRMLRKYFCCDARVEVLSICCCKKCVVVFVNNILSVYCAAVVICWHRCSHGRSWHKRRVRSMSQSVDTRSHAGWCLYYTASSLFFYCLERLVSEMTCYCVERDVRLLVDRIILIHWILLIQWIVTVIHRWYYSLNE